MMLLKRNIPRQFYTIKGFLENYLTFKRLWMTICRSSFLLFSFFFLISFIHVIWSWNVYRKVWISINLFMQCVRIKHLCKSAWNLMWEKKIWKDIHDKWRNQNMCILFFVTLVQRSQRWTQDFISLNERHWIL